MSTNTKRGFFWLTAIGMILAIPLIAMQFTQEVNWSLSDFLIFGGLLACVGLTYEFIIRKFSHSIKRTVLTLALIAAFVLIWAELAVGIFGTPFAGS
ncbi:hypothetical protein [Kangiella marina]|uniref:Uncharacterized protein n=1 Tax=Kangiella marina TaxID=1079178 RepID=A0ABP8IDH7_9GAMM